METVTISDESSFLREPDGREVLSKKLSCTCSWTGTCVVWRSEVMAKHHLLYTHGGGRYIFGTNSIDVGKDRDPD